MFRCKDLRHLAAALRHAALIELVEHKPPSFFNNDKVGIAQDGQVMGNGGLRYLELFHEFTDGERVAAAKLHDPLAGFVCQGFGKEDCFGCRWLLIHHTQII